MTFDRALPSASIGKWLGAVAISGAVTAGRLKFDTLANEVFDWWTSDPNDRRSRVTLRHLLTFTSGFNTSSFTHDPMVQTCLNANLFYTSEECAKQIYETADHACEPGTCLDYNSYHQNIAMGMAAKALAMDPRDVIKEYLVKPGGLTDTWWLGGQNPFMSGGIVTSGRDLIRFLKTYLGYTIAPKEIIEEMDMEYARANNAKVLNGMPFVENQTFGMSHDVQAPTHFWGGAFKAECWMNRTSGVYIMVMNGDLVEGLLDPAYPYVVFDQSPVSAFSEIKKALATLGY